MDIYFENEASLQAYAARLASLVSPPCTIFLSGNLGVGKTTFARGFLRGLGFNGHVKSPTFTLVEEYFLQNKRVYHFDFYRIRDAEELECLGIRDYFDQAVLLIEWSEHVSAYLPLPDLMYRFEILGSGRRLVAEGISKIGRQILEKL